MFEQRNLMQFLTFYLNTPVFSSLSQTQFFTSISRSNFELFLLAAKAASYATVAIACCLKFDREQTHFKLGG